MKHIIVAVLACFLFFPMTANIGDPNLNNSVHVLLHDNSVDPGHNQFRKGNLGKDRYPLEMYLGSHPSFALKLNVYGSKNGSLTESAYLMAGMDLDDQDIYAKIGFTLNPGKYNKNRAIFPSKDFPWMRAWRYVMTRKAIEIGYKAHFLDGEDVVSDEDDNGVALGYSQFTTKNYGGLTLNYTVILDAFAEKIVGKHMWWFFDMRTARRIRVKIDAGVFFNLDKFKQPRPGFFSLSTDMQTDSEGDPMLEENPNVIDEIEFNDDGSYNSNFGYGKDMPIFPFVTPFINMSIGFSLF
tara:strand:+ start:770 stop:1657 length:888 start_codon:yes stop_codon:yes gene_type:complete